MDFHGISQRSGYLFYEHRRISLPLIFSSEQVRVEQYERSLQNSAEVAHEASEGR